MATVFVFGDDIDTDLLAPGRYMASPIEELARHCLEGLDPTFAASVRPGDVLLAGRNFGMGSSREQAAQALKQLGLAGVVARSFGGIFYRNAINLGLPVFVATDPTGGVATGTEATLDVEEATLTLAGGDRRIALEPLAPFLRELIDAGGLVPHLERRFAVARGSAN